MEKSELSSTESVSIHFKNVKLLSPTGLTFFLTLLHSERPKLHRVLAILSAKGFWPVLAILNAKGFWPFRVQKG